MSFNPAKCKTISLSTKKVPPQRKNVFCGAELEQVDSISYPRVILNDNLKWSNHVSSISGKASKVLGMMDINSLKRVQRKAAQFCTNGYYPTAGKHWSNRENFSDLHYYIK